VEKTLVTNVAVHTATTPSFSMGANSWQMGTRKEKEDGKGKMVKGCPELVELNV